MTENGPLQEKLASWEGLTENLKAKIAFWEGLIEDFKSIRSKLNFRGDAQEADIGRQTWRFPCWLIDFINDAKEDQMALLMKPSPEERTLIMEPRTFFPAKASLLEELIAQRERLLEAQKNFEQMAKKISEVDRDYERGLHVRARYLANRAKEAALVKLEQIKAEKDKSNNL